MHIGIDASRANEQEKTGVQWYAYHVIQEMKKLTETEKYQDISVTLYSKEPLIGDLTELPSRWNSKVLNWPPKFFWTQARLSYEMLVHSPDVLFVPAHTIPLFHPKKTIMTVHDVAAKEFRHAYNWFERWYSLWTVKHASKSLPKIITISNFSKKEILDYVDTAPFIDVVPLGFNATDTQAKQKKPEKMPLPYILTVGRLEQKKNTVKIIQSYDLFRKKTDKKISLVLVGGKGYGYEEVRKAIADSPFKNDIIQLGWVDQDQMPGLFSHASLFLFPSLYEGFGIPVLESLAAHTPVVTSKGSSLQEVGGEFCVYVNPHSVEEIATGIEKGLQTALDTKEIDAYISKFSWKKTAEKTLDILIEVGAQA